MAVIKRNSYLIQCDTEGCFAEEEIVGEKLNLEDALIGLIKDYGWKFDLERTAFICVTCLMAEESRQKRMQRLNGDGMMEDDRG